MKKSAIVLFTALLSVSAFAQSVQEGVNHIYAERYQSAKSVFDKLIAANPNNIEANYWLGQTYIRSRDTAAALALYQKLITTNGNAPLALVGMGQVELMQGKTAEARQHFETALSLSRGKKGNDPNILLAIGRANTDAKAGDIAYALQKLNEAAQLASNNAEVFLAIGNANRKIQGNGSQAATAFLKAANLNPGWALPYYRLAKIYFTQKNWDIYIENLNKALSIDPKFAPAYSDLYDYNLIVTREFSKAEEYANKYISSSDPSLDNDYMKAQTYYVQKRYDDAINAGKTIIQKGGERTNPKVYKMVAYSLIEKGDSVGARPYVEQYFAKVDPEDIIGFDYVLQADAYASDNPSAAREAYLKAAKMDSILTNQVKVLNQGIERFKKSGHKILEADLRLLSYQLRGTQANPAELFQIGLPYYQGRSFQRADSVFTAYSTALPDSIYGYYWSAQSRAQIDTSMEQGLAVPMYLKTLEVAEKNPTRFKTQGVIAAGYLTGYAFNIKKDKEQAMSYINRGLALDPTNTTLLNAQKAVQNAGKPRSQTSTSTNTAKDGETKVKTDSKGAVKKVKTK
jgi:tetratricopeptide (TPR) repeat protein